MSEAPLDLVAVRHSECGGVAFHYLGRPSSGEMITASRVIYADGYRPIPYDTVRCEGCGLTCDFSSLTVDGGYA